MRLRIVVVSACAALALAGCSSSGSGGGSKSDSSPAVSPPPSKGFEAGSSSSPSSSAASSTAASSSAAPSAAAKPVKVGKTVSDPVLGEKFTVLSYLRGFTVPAAVQQKYSALQDEEVVLVQVSVTASSKYYDSFGADSFTLTDTKNGIDESSTTILDSTISQQNLKPLADADTGKSSTGWIVFTPKKGNLKSLTLRYERLQATTSNGKTIPKKDFDVPLA